MRATAIRVVIVASAFLAFGVPGGIFAEGVELPHSDEEAISADAIAAEVQQEKALKEQELRLEAQQRYEAAGAASRDGDYDTAIRELIAAVAADPDNETYKEALKATRIMQINRMLSDKKFAEAKQLCDQLLLDDPGNEVVVGLRATALAELEKPPAPAAAETPPVPAEVLEPTAEQLVQEADDLMRKKDYRLALDKLLDAREINPYDIQIDKKIRQVQQQLTRYERAFADAMREQMLTEIEEAWSRRPRRVTTYAVPEVGPTEEPPSKAREEILRKLELMIPEVKFEDAKLTEVIDFLSREAAVNIVIDPVVFQGGYSQPTTGLETTPGLGPTPGGPTMTPGGMPGPGGTTFPPTETYPGVTSPGITTPGMIPPATAPGLTDVTSPMGPTYIPPVEDTGITVRLTNVPLREVLKYVLKWKNLKYVVEDYAILIAPIDYVPPESLETHIFRLATTGIGIIERPELSTPGLEGPSDTGAGPTSPFDTFPGSETASTTETIREFLINSGVPWPRGSNIIYNRRTGTLIVTNTPTNMVLVRELVDLWDQPALQVEIESRFVEILLTRYFENSWEIDMLSPLIFTQSNKGLAPAGVRKRVEFEAHPSRGTRYFPQLLPLEFPTPDADSVFSISGIMTNPDFQFTWRAINQKDFSDLLSAPRVTTISGQQAQIEVVQELTYPTEYDTETINIGGGWGGTTNLLSGEVFMVTPGNWEERDVGIILNVTPTVSADGKMINLVLMPEVTDLISWVNYGNDIYPINQPIFETRNITTTVHVEDGETIVLGGLITDKTTTYEDKVPLLGSIPFVGRFFRSAAEVTSKANLVIFVTARLITSKGIELRAERAERDKQASAVAERIRETREETAEMSSGMPSPAVIE